MEVYKEVNKMSDGGKWHGETISELTKELKGLGHVVYSEGVRKDNGELIQLDSEILGKMNNIRIITRLYVESEEIARPDLVIIENNHVKYIIEIEEGLNPKKIAGIIVVDRNSNNCKINLQGKKDENFEVQGAKLYVVTKNYPNRYHIKIILEDVDISKTVNLSEIQLISYDEFKEIMFDL